MNLWLRYRNKWRRALGIIEHPSGDRYALEPMANEPNTVALSTIASTLWSTPEPKIAA